MANQKTAIPQSREETIVSGLKDFHNSCRDAVKAIALVIRVLILTIQYQKDYPLTAMSLRSALFTLVGTLHYGQLESLFLVTHDQINTFLKGKWDYTEEKLRLLKEIAAFPGGAQGVRMLWEYWKRIEKIENYSFEETLLGIYENPLYPIHQHIGYAFRNVVIRRIPFLIEFFASTAPTAHRVCDVGCGIGIILGDLLERFPKVQGYGLDVSSSVLDYGKRVLQARHLDHREKLIVGDLRFLPFQEETFDIVMAMEVLEHLPNAHLGLLELMHITVVGGYLIISVPIGCPWPGHMHVFDTAQEVVELCQAVGLKVVHHEIETLTTQTRDLMIVTQKIKQSI